MNKKNNDGYLVQWERVGGNGRGEEETQRDNERRDNIRIKRRKCRYNG